MKRHVAFLLKLPEFCLCPLRTAQCTVHTVHCGFTYSKLNDSTLNDWESNDWTPNDWTSNNPWMLKILCVECTQSRVPLNVKKRNVKTTQCWMQPSIEKQKVEWDNIENVSTIFRGGVGAEPGRPRPAPHHLFQWIIHLIIWTPSLWNCDTVCIYVSQ
jgi:hypothetical protein